MLLTIVNAHGKDFFGRFAAEVRLVVHSFFGALRFVFAVQLLGLVFFDFFAVLDALSKGLGSHGVISIQPARVHGFLHALGLVFAVQLLGFVLFNLFAVFHTLGKRLRGGWVFGVKAASVHRAFEVFFVHSRFFLVFGSFGKCVYQSFHGCLHRFISTRHTSADDFVERGIGLTRQIEVRRVEAFSLSFNAIDDAKQIGRGNFRTLDKGVGVKRGKQLTAIDFAFCHNFTCRLRF